MGLFPRALPALIAKNFKLQWTDKRTLFAQLIVPILIGLIFSVLGNLMNEGDTWTSPEINPYSPIGSGGISLYSSWSRLANRLYWWDDSDVGNIMGIWPSDHPIAAQVIEMTKELDTRFGDSDKNLAPKIKLFKDKASAVKYNQFNSTSRLTLGLDLTRIPLLDSDFKKDADNRKIYEFKVYDDTIDTNSQTSLYNINYDKNRYNEIDSINSVWYAQWFLQYAIMWSKGYTIDEKQQSPVDLDLAFVAMPHRGYAEDTFGKAFNSIMAGMFTTAFSSTVASLVSILVQEKEVFISYVMEVMGATKFLMIVSHFLTNGTISILPLSIVAYFMKRFLYKAMSYFAIWPILACYFLAILAFGCFMSTFFSKAKTAVTLSSLGFTILAAAAFAQNWLPVQIIQLMYFFNFQTVFAAVNTTLYDLDTRGESMTLIHNFTTNAFRGLSPAVGCLLFLFQMVFYLTLSVYFENILPGEFKSPLPLYYPFLPSYWRAVFTGNSRGVDEAIRGNNAPLHESDALLLSSQTSVNSDDAVGLQSQQQVNHHPGTRPEFIQPLTTQEQQNIGIKLTNVVKEFDTNTGIVRAVDNLSISFLRNQISVLLGHNGSGKSTTVNQISRLYHPTSGKIELWDSYGNKLDNPNGYIGICPQYNALLENLTVLDHMWLFSAIKQQAMGVTYDQGRVFSEIMTLLNRLKLGPTGDNKSDAIVKTLSGGQKRKVCLAIALLHSPPIVILDEVSTGTDISIQRSIWKLLQEEKANGKTILLLTHSMEEAEIGDRISILTKGQLMCSGSSLFLKQAFNVGYLLQLDKIKQPGVFDRITKIDNSINNNLQDKKFGDSSDLNNVTTHSGQAIVNAIQQQFPPDLAQLLSIHTDTQHHIIFSISLEKSDFVPQIIDRMEDMRLNRQTSGLNITDVSLTITTLSDIFLLANTGYTTTNANAVEELSIEERQQQRLDYQTNNNDPDSRNVPLLNTNIDDGYNNNNNGSIPLSAISTPTSPNTSGGGGLKTAHVSQKNEHNVDINTSIWDKERQHVHIINLMFIQILALLKKRFIIAYRDWKTTCRNYLFPIIVVILFLWLKHSTNVGPEITQDYHRFPINTPIEYGQWKDATNTTQTNIDHSNAFAKEFATYTGSTPTVRSDVDNYIQWNSSNVNNPYYFDRYQYNLYTNDTFDQYTPKNPRIVATNVFQAEFSPQDHTLAIDMKIYVNQTQLYAIPSFATRVFELITDKIGIDPMTFRPTIQGMPQPVMRDFLSAGITMALLLCCVIYPQSIINFMVKERQERVVHLHRISGLQSYTYYIAYFIFDLFQYAMMCAIVIGGILIFDLPHPSMRAILLGLLAYGIVTLLFTYAIALLFDKPTSAQIFILLVLLMGPFILAGGIAAILYATSYRGAWGPWFKLCFIIPSAGLGYAFITLGLKSVINVPNQARLLGEWLAFSPIYIVVLIAMQAAHNYKLWEQMFNLVTHIQQKDERTIDPDVLQQEQDIRTGQFDHDIDHHPLVCKGLRKNFGKLVAVNNLYFKIPKQTIFALLGANGGGKSTTLAVLTADLWNSESVESQNKMTEHNAFIHGHSIKTEPSKAHNYMGFCPQFDALNLELSARETLTLYSHLRGVTGEDCRAFITDLLNVLGLQYAADRPASGYSMGMRRRLSLGLSLVGNPEIVILDEAASGVDPISRKNLQLLLQQTCKNRTVLMTSHHLDEVEALCDSIGVMSRGELKTIGTKSDLKKKLGDEFVINLGVIAGYEHYVAAHVLSLLTNIQISGDIHNILKLNNPDYRIQYDKEIENAAQQIPRQPVNMPLPLSDEEVTNNSIYKNFIMQCQFIGGARIVEQRYMTVTINVKKSICPLSQLFDKVKNIKSTLLSPSDNTTPLIQSYAASQISIDQIFLDVIRRDENERNGDLAEMNVLAIQTAMQTQQQHIAMMQQQQQQLPPQQQYIPQYQQQQQPMQQQNLFMPQQPMQPQQQNLFTPQQPVGNVYYTDKPYDQPPSYDDDDLKKQ